jgi:hypothetical protein
MPERERYLVERHSDVWVNITDAHTTTALNVSIRHVVALRTVKKAKSATVEIILAGGSTLALECEDVRAADLLQRVLWEKVQ